MMTYVVLLFVGLFAIAVIGGFGKRTIFTNPASLSDAQIERTIRLTQRIMDNSKIGTRAWDESSAKFAAALNEQRRRAGLYPLSINLEDTSKL